jgi:putative addiction module component (TIGR02574 family)
MSSTKLKISDEFESASKSERIEFVQELWDQIASDPDAVIIPEHHKSILDERLEELERNPESGQPWSEVRERLLTALRNS